MNDSVPLVSVIVLNYNAASWIPRCLESLRSQTIFSQIEVIVADNASPDNSEQVSRKLLADWPNGRFLQLGANLGFGKGTNEAVRHARGKYLYLLNPDTWLEPNCLAELLAVCERQSVAVAGAAVFEYDDCTPQSYIDTGLDIFGYPVGVWRGNELRTAFTAGNFFFISKDLFTQLGGFDEEFFMYVEELDLCWRIWLVGESIWRVPMARIHHRGEASVNPRGGTRIVEFRTSQHKRFYANRNILIVLLTYPQHILFVMLLANVSLQLIEGLFWLLITRRWAFARETCLKPIAESWRLRKHIASRRRRVRAFRKHGDFWMLRFVSPRFGRWQEIRRMFKLGLPKAG